MAKAKADLVKRVLAALVDGLAASVVSLIPVIGALVGTAYTLTKDAIVFELTKQNEWKNRSLGKRLLNLEVSPDDGDIVDLMTSVKRNIPLAIGTLIMIIPVVGWVVGPIIAFVVSIIEIVLVITDGKGRRLGDRWAGTQVVDAVVTASVGGDVPVDRE